MRARIFYLELFRVLPLQAAFSVKKKKKKVGTLKS